MASGPVARAAGGTLVALSAGFGIGAIWATLHLGRTGELPMTPFGWRLMGSTVPGMGADQLTLLGRALAWVLIGVSAVDVATSRWLWQGRRRGSVIGLATTPVSLALGLLFHLPFLIVVAPLRAGLVIAESRRSPRPGAQ